MANSLLRIPERSRTFFVHAILACLALMPLFGGCGGCSKTDEPPEVAAKKTQEEAAKKALRQAEARLRRAEVLCRADRSESPVARRQARSLAERCAATANQQLRFDWRVAVGSRSPRERADGANPTRGARILARNTPSGRVDQGPVSATGPNRSGSFLAAQCRARSGFAINCKRAKEARWSDCPDELIDVMPPYQYFLCLLAREPTRLQTNRTARCPAWSLE